MLDRDAGSTTPFWNEFTIVLFAVLIEHLLLFSKSILALLIEDVPVEVVHEERRRVL
jgi:hypothetical protein